MDGIPQSGSYTLSQHVFQIFPTVILRCVTPQKAGDSMNIGIVGAGKVGFSFGRLLAKKGMRISGYYSRNSDSAEEAAEFTNSGHYTDLGKFIEDSDAIFITVPDNAITEVYRQVAEFEIQDKYICHCSGACTAEEAFPGIHAQGAYAISIHLLFPISSKYNCWRELAGAFFASRVTRRRSRSLYRCCADWGCRCRIFRRRARRSTTSAVHWQATLSAHLCSAAPNCWAAADSPKRTHCTRLRRSCGAIWRM